MTRRLKLHPTYGLNPTVLSCLICGKDKNEIALLGASMSEQAPMHTTDIMPCEACREKYLKDGVLMVEATLAAPRKGRPPRKPRYNPTGSFAVITDQAWCRIFTAPLPPLKICFVEPGIFERLNIKMEEKNG